MAFKRTEYVSPLVAETMREPARFRERYGARPCRVQAPTTAPAGRKEHWGSVDGLSVRNHERAESLGALVLQSLGDPEGDVTVSRECPGRVEVVSDAD